MSMDNSQARCKLRIAAYWCVKSFGNWFPAASNSSLTLLTHLSIAAAFFRMISSIHATSTVNLFNDPSSFKI